MADEQNVTAPIDAKLEEKIDIYLAALKDELIRAYRKHPAKTDSRHHGYGVIAEEFREFEEKVFKDYIPGARVEVAQLGAMCVRYLIDTPEK